MNLKTILMATAMATATAAAQQQPIGKMVPRLTSDLMTPEVLWQMGRIGSVHASPDGKTALYGVTYYSKEQNKSRSLIYQLDLATRSSRSLTRDKNESGAVYIHGGKQIAYIGDSQGESALFVMNADGTERREVTGFKGFDDFLFSPDGTKVILVKAVEQRTSIRKNDADLDKATGMVIDDLMYKHWDHYVTTAPHPFVLEFDGRTLSHPIDLLEGEPFECPMEPFGGVEQLAWSPDGQTIAYTCRKKTGRDYAISTDSDIYLYDVKERRTVKNLCKPADWKQPEADPTRSLAAQPVNTAGQDCNVGYDQNPRFSPDGKYVAWTSMERDGYESDRQRLCVYERATGKKHYVTEQFESGVDEFLWSADSKTLYFSGVWHGKKNVYRTNLKGEVQALTEDVADYSLVSLLPSGNLLAKRHSISHPDEIFLLTPQKKGLARVEQLTEENKVFFEQLTMGEVKERWVKTVDGKQEQCWVIYPPHFDPTKKYPALLYCEGGPQSPVSQFWSYRWNFQIMAAHGYIIIAPNRRGLPGYGMEWLEEISGDYTGLCMQDYLSAIDDLCREPYVDTARLGAVGASFGGFSVYWLAGHHEGRFKALIAHDGIYNTQQQYVETEEMWFPNWDLGAAPWLKENGQARKAYEQSPHLYVDKWTAPILCIHGQKDFRIEYTQAESAFSAARMRGIPAQLLLFPDENHWVLKPQNGILWQRTFFRWLDKWLKK